MRMFSNNRKISGRQTFRLLTYDMMGLGTLLIPSLLARGAGRDGIFCILLGTGAALCYFMLLTLLLRDMKGDFFSYLREKTGRFFCRLLLTGYLLYFVLLASYTAYLFSDIVLKNLLREESYWLVLVLILLLVCYGMWEGLESRARVYEILFWFVMIPLFLMLISAINEIQVDYWTPVFTADLSDVFGGSYAVFLPLSLIFLALFLGEHIEKKEDLLLAGRRAVVFAGGIYAVLYLILLGIYGAVALGTMEFPAITLMSTVKISGGFLKRTDAFMFGIWFFTLYALLGSTVFYGAAVLRALTGMEVANASEKARIRRERLSTVIVLFAVLVTAGIFYLSREVCRDCEGFLWYIGTPFVVAVPLLLAFLRFLRGRQGKAALSLVLILATSTVLSGCNTVELEERNFPIEIAVEDTDSFAWEWLDADQTGNRLRDYSHLKVLIISREFLEDECAMEEFLDLLEDQTDVPRNTYVVSAENPERLMERAKEREESLGNYLEQMFENVSAVKKKMYPTLGMLYQEKENRLETLFIPFVAERDNEVVVERYYVWKRGKAAGLTDSGTALLSFFTQNGTDAYTLVLESGAIRLTAPHNEISFQEMQGKEIVVDVYCEGEAIYGETAVLEQ